MIEKWKHPLRRKKHRRGRRGGKKHQPPPTPPEKIVSLRQRLHTLSRAAS